MSKYVIGITASASIVILFAIVALIAANALPFMVDYSIMDFLTGTKWHPVADPPEFGLLPLLWGTVIVTLCAMVIAIPLGIATGLYFHAVAPKRVREIFKPMIEVLGAIPSVIYGLFGLTILAPFAQRLLSIPVGQCAAVAGATLGIMIVPIIVSISEDALEAVPFRLWEGSLALGATRFETLMRIILPASGRGIVAATVLGFGRAIGETMTVLMVAGGGAQISLSPFVPVRPMTMAIAAEMGESARGSLHFHALFMVAGVLFIITLIINLLANRYTRTQRNKLK